MPDWPLVAAAGLVVGLLFGLFGIGGSSFATPALGLLGVPGLIAVASPLPATIPLALVGMRVLVPLREPGAKGQARRRPAVVVPAAAGVGLFTGLLANGGGFLLVPLFFVVLALTITEAAGTSLLVVFAVYFVVRQIAAG